MERRNQLQFKGEGRTLFGLTIVNTILTLITLGLYYPWAKVKYLQYYYQNFYMSGDHFSFHGTGKEIFKGFIKAILFIVALFVIYAIFIAIKVPIIGVLIYALGFLLIIPIAMHGTMRYRLAKTSWRSIHFGYRGNITKLIKLYLKGVGLTLVTLGIYSYWFEMKIRSYLFEHIRFGNIKLGFKGKGLDFFLLNLKGGILTSLTLGIYSFWYFAELFQFYYKNTVAEHDGKTYELDCKATAGDIFKLYVVNILLVVFTLGLGYAWARVRTMKFMAENIVIPEDLNTDNVVQTESDFDDATGDSMFDFLDFNFIF